MSAATTGVARHTQRNDIPQRQNAPDMLAFLRAKSALYDDAQRSYRLQAVLLVGVPLALAVAKILDPSLTNPAAVVGFVLFWVDFAWLEPRQKTRKTLGAKMQERFDCSVLDLPWRAERNGAEPTPEEVARWSGRHASTAALRNWYNPAVGRLPLALARIACQRANGNWNATMRRRYADLLRVAARVAVFGLLGAGYVRDANMRSVVLMVVTLAPFLHWSAREQRRQQDAAAVSERVRDRALAQWRRLLIGDADPATALYDARELQNDIYDQRKGDQQMFAFVYRRFRDRDEEEMRVAVESLVAEYEIHVLTCAA